MLTLCFGSIFVLSTDTFDASYRPVPLTTHVIGQGFVGENSSSQFRFWSSLNRNVPELVLRFSNQRPTVIFCHSKPDTEKLADLLANANGLCLQGNGNHDIAGQTKLTKLQRVLYRGMVSKCMINARERRSSFLS